MLGVTTKTGKEVAKGLVYRSNQLFSVSAKDMEKVATLHLKKYYDLKTKPEITKAPDEIPQGVGCVALNV